MPDDLSGELMTREGDGPHFLPYLGLLHPVHRAVRNFGIFILKTLLPLFLLVLVVFATLFFPETLFRERITLPVTAILTSAVLLVSVNSQLGDVGYTVAIEIVFYVFFGLCLMTMVAGFAHEQLRQRGQGRLAAILDRSAQVAYVVTVIGVVALFVWDYRDLSGLVRP